MACNVSEYVVPEVAPDKDVVVMASERGTPGVMVTTAVPDLVESAVLVAVTVARVLVVTTGAW
jgi:hypothetical protein